MVKVDEEELASLWTAVVLVTASQADDCSRELASLVDQSQAQAAGLVFKSSGDGQGQHLGNNNGSNRNLDSTCYQMLWYSVNYTGYSYGLGPYPLVTSQATGSQLGILRNNLRSHHIYSCNW